MNKEELREKVIKRLLEEHYKRKPAETKTKEELIEQLSDYADSALLNVKECLLPYVEAWANGEEPEFEFYGLTSSFIMERDNGQDYCWAIETMNWLLDNPNFFIPEYKKTKFGEIRPACWGVIRED